MRMSSAATKKEKQRLMQRVQLLKERFSHWMTLGCGACDTFSHFEWKLSQAHSLVRLQLILLTAADHTAAPALRDPECLQRVLLSVLIVECHECLHYCLFPRSTK